MRPRSKTLRAGSPKYCPFRRWPVLMRSAWRCCWARRPDANAAPTGENCRYRTGNADIAFIDGKADWITLFGFGDIAPGIDALSLLGLEPMPADSQSDTEMRWRDTQGLREILLVHDASRIRYARIKTSTP